MTCFHTLEVPSYKLGHFLGKNFDYVFEIFGSGPKSQFGQKILSPSLRCRTDDSNEYRNFTKTPKNGEKIKIFIFGNWGLIFSFKRVGLKIDLLWVLKRVFWWNNCTSRLPMDHPNWENSKKNLPKILNQWPCNVISNPVIANCCEFIHATK